MSRSRPCVVFAALAISAVSPVHARAERPAQVLACGDDQIRVYEESGTGMHEVWRWTAATTSDLPGPYRTAFLKHMDDCKIVDDGKAILATASTGGVILIDRKSMRVTFHAHTPNAHSADLLPHGRIAVALSVNKAGNRLLFFDRHRNEKPILQLDLKLGHGAVWDEARQRLFALSGDLVHAFRLDDWTSNTPRVTETGRWELPGKHNGHDLSLDPGTRGFVVSTADGVWRFSPESGTFAPLAFLNPARDVKAVTFRGDRVAWVQAEESWWAYGFMLARRDGSNAERVNVDGLHLYKVRWLQ